MKVLKKLLAELGGSLEAWIFYPTAALLVGHESRFAPSSRLAFGKNLSREIQRSYRAAH
jgi:hypothetical protein